MNPHYLQLCIVMPDPSSCPTQMGWAEGHDSRDHVFLRKNYKEKYPYFKKKKITPKLFNKRTQNYLNVNILHEKSHISFKKKIKILSTK